MYEAVAPEFPFVEAMPKRDKSRWQKVWDHFNELRSVVAQKGMLVPQHLAAAVLGVSRQRVHVLVNEGRLEAVEVDGYRYVTEQSVVAFADTERKVGRPLKVPSNSELWKISLEHGRKAVSKKTS